MTHRIRLLAGLLLLLAASSAAPAQRSLEPDGQAPQGPGQLIVTDPHTGAHVRLPIARYRARLVLHPPAALVQIEQTFDNPHGRLDAGTFAINLPVGASVCRFATSAAGGQVREAELVDRRPAWGAHVDDDAAPADSPAIAGIGSYLFRIRIPEVAADAEQRIWFDYTIPLLAEDGAYRFRLPLRSDLKPIAEFEVRGTILPPVETQSVQVEWQGPSGGVPTTVQMPRRKDGGIDFEWRTENATMPQALQVQYREPPERAPRARTCTVREKDGVGSAWQYFVVTIPAEEPTVPEVPAEPVDLLIIADTSGSVRDLPRLRQAVGSIVAALRPEDRIQLGCVDAEYRAISPDWATSGSAAAEAALKALDRELPLGASNLWHAVATAGSALERGPADRRRAVVYIGDGISTDGPLDGDWRNARLARGVTFSAVHLGQDERGREFLRNVVRLVGGRLFRVQRELRPLAGWVRAGMPEPRQIVELRVAPGEDLECFTPECWLRGTDLVLSGRCRPTRLLRVSLALRGEDAPRDYTLDLPPDDGTDLFVGRLWAQHQLASLLSRGPEKDEARTSIVRLGQEWSLVTPYSAFLVPGIGLESSRWLAGRGLRRRYWEPPGNASANAAGKAPEPRGDRRPQLALSRAEQAALAECDLLESLGGRRGLLDRKAVEALPVADPLLRSLALSGMSPEYLEHHPFAPQLLQRLTLHRQAVTLADFVKLLTKETGLNVLLDAESLAEVGVTSDEEVTLPYAHSITARSLLQIMLRNVAGQALDYTIDEHVLRITTQECAEAALQHHIYPVVDLVRTDVLPELSRLADPFAEVERAVQRRVRSRLREPITVHFDQTPLNDVAAHFAAHLGVTVLIDEENLSDIGIAPDAKISLSAENVQAERVLELLLENVQGEPLDYFCQNEVLTITTRDDAEAALTTRIYPSSGVVYDAPEGLIPERPKGGGGFGFGGGIHDQDQPADTVGVAGDPGFSVIGPPRTTGDDITNEAGSRTDDARFRQPPVAGASPASTGAAGFVGHLQEVIELIEDQTEGPWLDIDGIGGTVDAFLPSLSLIVRQKQRVHHEVEEILNRLHGLPPASVLVRPARVPRITADQREGWDLSAIIDVLQNETEGPWLDIDGIGGTISGQTPTMALSIRQTRRVHEEIHRLLTDLRRSRYVAEWGLTVQGIRPIDEYRLFGEETRVTELRPTRRRAELPPPSDDKLRLLVACRREPMGRCVWRRTAGDGDGERIAVTTTGPRLELEIAQRVFRADDDRAAAAYPELTLVELGPWDEAVRELADARLPWLPHRSNADLARLFEVTKESSDERQTTLRLSVPDLNDAYFLASFSRESQSPIAWEAQLNGARRYRLTFDDAARDSAEPGGRVTLEDASGSATERWELTAVDPSAAVPELTAGWEAYVVDDLDRPEGLYRRARLAASEYDYDAAARLVREALAAQPSQPLLNLLLAWLIEFTRERESARSKQEATLRTVARSGASGLVELIESHHFPALDEEQLYSLLLEQPAERRTADNWDRLADLARALGRHAERLQHVEAALRQTPETDLRQRRARLLRRIDALLALQRTAEAAQYADELLLQAGGNTDPLLADIADLFYAAGDSARGDGYVAQAIGNDAISPEAHRDLLVRQAQWRSGVARWRLLLRAAEISGEDHRQRGALVARIIGELTGPEHLFPAGLLADEAHTPEVRALLKTREAELTPDHEAAAAIALSLHAAGNIPPDRFDWLVTTVLQGRRYEEAARLLEERAHAERLPQALREKLIEAYRALGWQREARRAESDESEQPDLSTQTRQAEVNGGGFF